MWMRLFLVVLISVSLCGPGFAQTEEPLEVFPVSDAPGCQGGYLGGPEISGDIAVWGDGRNGGAYDSDIYACDLATGREFPICTEPHRQWRPSVSNGIVVWKDERNEYAGDIYGYDIKRGAEFAVCTKPGAQTDPSISARYVVWADFRNLNSDIYACDLTTGREFPICTEPHNQWSPRVCGDLVVWADTRNDSGYWSNLDIYGFNLRTGEEFSICLASGNQTSPVTAGDLVVWVDARNQADTGLDIYGYRLSTREEFAICTAPGDQGDMVDPTIDGELVLWTDGRAGIYQRDVYAYDLAAGRESLLIGGRFYQGRPAISGANLVWKDCGRPGEVVGGNIYGTIFGMSYPPADHDPYIVAVIPDPMGPQMGLPYYLRVYVRNRSGISGTFNVTVTEESATSGADPADPTPRTKTIALPAYGDKRVIFGPYTHHWDWIPPPTSSQSFLDGTQTALSDAGELYNVTNDITKASNGLGGALAWLKLIDVYRAFEQCFQLQGATISGDYRYTVAIDGVEASAKVTDVTVTVPDWKFGSLQRAVIGRYTAKLPLLLWPIEALLLTGAEEDYRMAYDPDPDYTVIAVPEAIAYPELEEMPEGPDKRAAIAASGVVSLQRAIAESWVRYDGARQADDEIWMVRQLQAAGEYEERFQMALAEYRRLLNSVPDLFSAPTLNEVEAYKVYLADEGLPAEVSAMLMRQGWSQSDIDEYVTSIVTMPSEDIVGQDAGTLAESFPVPFSYPRLADSRQIERTIKWRSGMPCTEIVTDGTLAPDGAFIGDVQVRLQPTAPDNDSVSSIEYSLDDGDTWVPYSTEFQVTGFSDVLVLARATTPSGVMEAPPARRVILRGQTVFEDVPASSWAWQQVESAYWASVVNGFPDGEYHPELAVTRDQMAVYVARAIAGGDGRVPSPGPEPRFADVPPDSWAYRYVEYAAAQNVVQGYPEGDYRPDLVVTRDQMAVYVARAMVTPTGDAALTDFSPANPRNFPDVPASGYGSGGTEPFWAYKYVEYCVANGVVRGFDDGLYHPELEVTRDQMAVYIQRAMGLPIW